MGTASSSRFQRSVRPPRVRFAQHPLLFVILTNIALLSVTGHASAGAPQPDAIDGAALNAVGPPLTDLNTKISDPNWLVAWMLKPSRLRPGTQMPDADLTPAQAQAVAKYLYAGAPAAKEEPKWRGGDAQKGQQLFVARGCRGCHGIAPGEASVSPRVPNLAGVGLKVRGDWLYKWLSSPRAYDPRTAMPQLALTDDERRHLVAFLLSRTEGAETIAKAPRFTPHADLAKARDVIETFECASCHVLKGFPPPPPAFELAADASPDGARRNGRLLVAFYNCRGCHRIEGGGGRIAQHLERKSFAPPTLEGEGARVQPSWLVQFLQQPVNLRPWLQMRMPRYGFSEGQARALAAYFAALSGVAPADEPVAAAPDEIVTRGLRRLAHHQCTQCHPTSAEFPKDVDPENLSINFMLAKARLRPSWIRQFLARPKAIVGTQTRMPSVFYSSDGVPKVDDPDREIDAITTYLMHMTEPPEATLAKINAEKKSPAADVDWSTVQY